MMRGVLGTGVVMRKGSTEPKEAETKSILFKDEFSSFSLFLMVIVNCTS